jgi:resolvase-like protein
MRAAVYARVSLSARSATPPSTANSQLAARRAWAAAGGHILADEHVFRDEGYSGSRLDRPGLDALRDAVRDGAIGMVAVLTPDRRAQTRLPGPAPGGVPPRRLRGRLPAAPDLRRSERPAPAADPGCHRGVRARRSGRALPTRQAATGPRRALQLHAPLPDDLRPLRLGHVRPHPRREGTSAEAALLPGVTAKTAS